MPGYPLRPRTVVQRPASSRACRDGRFRSREYGCGEVSKLAVRFVDLAPTDDATLVMSAIARMLAVEESGGESLLGRLRQRLAARRTPLVLDNLEQVLAAAADLGELLGGCPDLKVPATSRALLQLRWEHAFAA